MIILLEPDSGDDVVDRISHVADQFEGIEVMTQSIRGKSHTVTEVYVLGGTAAVPTEAFEGLEGVRSVIRVSKKYKLIGRHHDESDHVGFEYNGVDFNDDHFHLFAGLCAVDNPDHVEQTMRSVAEHGQVTTRMGAYKPRTSPYDFQGRGKDCLPYVFEIAGRTGIKVVAMEVTSPRHIEEIQAALDESGNATGVMLQIGTRNAQNFELLKQVGQQRELPVLFKRGMGITLEESLNAAEYIAAEGNPHIIFCLRGVKSHLGNPHRNLVDFAHVPVVKRLTRLLVCVDPSHSVGRADRTPDGIPDTYHVLGQGIVAGATMGLVDLHPKPEVALCDGPQAITLDGVPRLVEYTRIMRSAYEQARDLFAQS
jgi:3-deoxy-7-phosphoheptulonate synthase